MNMKKTKKSSGLTSFLSLPDDVLLNCVAHISSIHRPTLSLVSKSFRSLLASHELKATESRMGKTTDDWLYVCLDLNKTKPNPRWFTLAPNPKQQRLVPIPSFPNQLPESSTVVSVGSEIYINGGYLKKEKCRSVSVLDFRSLKWRSLPNMCVPRACPAADVMDGKLYVIGGCNKDIYWGDWAEVYDLEKQTWELFSPIDLELTNQERVVPGKLVMGGKVYDNIFELNYQKHSCVVEIDKNVFFQIGVLCGSLYWRDAKEKMRWKEVKYVRLGHMSPNSNFPKDLVSVTNSCGGRRVTVWWKEVKYSHEGRCPNKECKTEIWCAEISLERCSAEELRGVVEWSKNVFTLDGCGTGFDFFLDYAIVSH